ncbi:MAG: imidazole glycerol phosphate synthase subunit HisH [Armatimonadetes bacterium]|nr:imidazole glycerol phosphate synthase subunit HisH [Armatimonadota bacterium]
MIGILDYGVGNLRSVERALNQVEAPCEIVTSLSGVDRLILQGVGAFAAAMARLAPLADDVRAFARAGQPLLGICLGQQLLFEVGEEMGETPGLGLIPGSVRYLPRFSGLKIPHIGWNEVRFCEGSPIGADIPAASQFYFVHSLAVQCAVEADVDSRCEYGAAFVSSVRRGSVWGVQFHPEKSGDAGLRLLRNFATC